METWSPWLSTPEGSARNRKEFEPLSGTLMTRITSEAPSPVAFQADSANSAALREESAMVTTHRCRPVSSFTLATAASASELSRSLASSVTDLLRVVEVSPWGPRGSVPGALPGAARAWPGSAAGGADVASAAEGTTRAVRRRPEAARRAAWGSAVGRMMSTGTSSESGPLVASHFATGAPPCAPQRAPWPRRVPPDLPSAGTPVQAGLPRRRPGGRRASRLSSSWGVRPSGRGLRTPGRGAPARRRTGRSPAHRPGPSTRPA